MIWQLQRQCLCCLGEASEAGLEKSAFIGELGLDGCVKPVKGVLPRVFAAAGQGIRRMFVPSENTAEGTAVKDIEIIGVNSLSELAGILSGRIEAAGHWFDEAMFREEDRLSYPVDYDEMLGLPTVRRACQAAAAGRHNILFIGPAGTGKTMAARRLPTIMPPITLEESIEVSKIYSICGLLKKEEPLIRARPFRARTTESLPRRLPGEGGTPGRGRYPCLHTAFCFSTSCLSFRPPFWTF